MNDNDQFCQNSFSSSCKSSTSDLESTVLSVCNISALIIDSFDEKAALGWVIVETLKRFNEIVHWFSPAFSRCKYNCSLLHHHHQFEKFCHIIYKK